MSEQDIAIIGMAGRFPGAPTIADYWTNLRDGVSAIRALSDKELLTAGVTVTELADPAYVRMCPVLDGIDEFDAGFFGVSPRDASVMDPAHRMFLEVAWEALEHAGQAALPEEGAVGVFATSGAPYYLMDHVRRNPDVMRSMGEFLARHTNNDMNFLATRVSYEMDLRGPSINIQTACSSALVAVHMACESIRRDECAMALAGGATVNIPHGHGYLYREGEILSPDGICRPFDAASAGTVFGSGVGCVVLKRLSAALDDGDTIHAVIKGSAVNNDGALRVGYLAPGVDGQANAVRRALELSAVPAESISYIETHGTGTRVGDPIEVAALTQAFRGQTQATQFCAIGSVKSNIGHLGEAAGIAALIKVVLALKHRQLPPSLAYRTPNPQIAFSESPFFVNDRLRPWTAAGPLRCGITALGAGGTNCHMVLEEAPARIEGEGAREIQLLVLSAHTATALEGACENLAQALEDDPALDLADAAYTLAVGRRPMPHRAALAVRDAEDAIAQLRDRDPKRVVTQRAVDGARPVVFMFPGGGAQYAGMGRELFESEPVYRDAMEECLVIVNARLGRDLGALMFASATDTPSASRELERPALSLPALFSTEYALARLFVSWGIEPTAYVGHSMGEYVAACLSDVMTLEEALELVMLRGRLFESVPRGRMLSVPMSEQDLRAILPAGLDIAAVNAAELCAASGPETLIALLESTLAERRVETTRVRIDVAAHSAMLDTVLDEFRRFCRTISLRAPRVPFVSNVSGRWITDTEATDPEYWVRHLRSTVRFADCLGTVRASGERVLLEVGPGRTLTSLARAQQDPVPHAFNSMRHPDEQSSAVDYALLTLGRLWSCGVTVEWSALYDGQLRNRIPLPTYAWDHQRYWLDAPRSLSTPIPTAAAGGARREGVEGWYARPSWRQTMPAPPLAPSDERVVVFCDAVGIGEALAICLAESGRRVVRVHAGPAYSSATDRFMIRPGVLADHEQMLKALAASGGLPHRLVHCWSVTDRAGAAPVDVMLEKGFHSLMCFAQALGAEAPDAALTLDVVTSNLQRVAGEEYLDPAKALVLGPTRVMPRELPNVRTRAIDLVVPTTAAQRDALVRRLADEVGSGPTDATIAYRGSERFVQVTESVTLPTAGARVKEKGRYLITGGLGGIGFALAQHLATEHHARLVLIGRGASAAQARKRIHELEALGAEVEVAQADVTSVEQLRMVLERARTRFGGIDGVFHTAGVLGDSLMALKTREDAERVLAPKVFGTLALDVALEGAPIDFLMLFSSISALAGLPGQADYTAANAFLDAFAAERSLRTDSLTVSVNWSAWRDVGMVANIVSGAGIASGVGEEVHPVLGRRLWAGSDGELFTSELRRSAQWVLAEHRLRGGRTLMPGTGYLEIVRAALSARAEPRTLEMRDVSFISALPVDDDAPREMRVRVARTGHGLQAFVIATRGEDESGAPVWQEHVTGSGGYVDAETPPPLNIEAVAARCDLREQRFVNGVESAHMEFGPRWSNLRAIRYGKGEALVTLELPAAFSGDLATYRLHPALMDLATGGSTALVPGYDAARDFYVPLSYARVRMFAGLPARIHSHVRLVSSDFASNDIVVFDVTITDAVGRVLVEIDEFMMTRVTDNEQLEGRGARAARSSSISFEPPASPGTLPAMLRRVEEAIRPAEGMRAIEQILAGPAVPQVVVTPLPFDSLLEALLSPAERPSKPPGEPVKPMQRFDDAEERLSTHPAVERAIVVDRFDRPGKRHVVGYVVPRAGEHPTASELRRFVKKDLTPASVPGVILLLESLPLDASGALDLTQLHDPFALADDFIAPRTPTEQAIAEIWKDALGVKQVGVRDNFFDIGGHSLLAVRAVVRLDRTVGVRLNQAVMVMQTLEQIASEVDRQLALRQDAAGASPVTDTGGAQGRPEPSGGFFRALRNAVAGKGQ